MSTRKSAKRHSKRAPSARRPARKTPTSTKVAEPRLLNVHARTRLFRELDRALAGRVTWIVAPAGYGKTTLVASYLQARKRQTLWYQMDQGDRDVANFFHYLSLAARQAAPGRRISLPKFTPEYFGAPETFARRCFEELGARLPHDSVCVFDNYQDLAADAPLHEILHEAIGWMPSSLRIVIVSRAEPPPSLAVDRANRLLTVIGRDSLALTPQESFRICRQRLPGPPLKESRRIAEALHERARGWAAGLVLMLERWSHGRDAPAESGDAAPQPLFDYFYRELFLKADDETRALLLRTCDLPTVSANVAQQLTGNRRAGELLARLHADNLFTLRHAGTTPSYQYHPLLRAFLHTQAELTLERHERVQLSRRSADILEREGRVEEAARLLAACKEWGALASLAVRQAPALLADGRHRTVLGWLEQLPDRTGDPWLVFWEGACRFPFDLAAARALFETAYAKFAQGTASEGVLLCWASIVEAIVFEASDFAALDGWIAALENRSALAEAPCAAPVYARFVAAMVSALMYRQPSHPRIAEWVERLATIVSHTPDASARVMLGAHLFVYRLAWRGDLVAARTTLRLLQPPRGRRLSPMAEILLHVCRANWCWMAGEPDAALAAVDAGQRLADEHGIVVWTFRLTCTAADVLFSKGDLARARPYLARLEATLVPEQTAYLAFSLMYRAWAAGLGSNTPAAVATAREVLALFDNAGAPWPITASHLHLAGFLREAGEFAEADARAREGLESARAFRSALLEYWALTSLASTQYAAGNTEAGERHLRGAFALGQRHSYERLTYYINDAESAAALCVHALQSGIEERYTLAMIRERKLHPPGGRTAPETWPFSVRVHTLDGFALRCDGKAVRAHGKAQQRPLGLLKALIALGGHAVPEAQLAEALWPAADGDAARQSLTAALHRLRKLLGLDAAIRLHDRQLTLDSRYVWVDAWAFERLIEQAEHEGDPARAKAAIEDACGHYRAPFLSADAEPWALAMRERLRAKLLRAVERLGHQLEREQQWDAALHWYQRGVDTDPLAETLYRRQMACYDALRRPAEALATYGRCEAALGTLEIPPSAETRALSDRIRTSARNR